MLPLFPELRQPTELVFVFRVKAGFHATDFEFLYRANVSSDALIDQVMVSLNELIQRECLKTLLNLTNFRTKLTSEGCWVDRFAFRSKIPGYSVAAGRRASATISSRHAGFGKTS
jgi:hypothetical protein